MRCFLVTWVYTVVFPVYIDFLKKLQPACNHNFASKLQKVTINKILNPNPKSPHQLDFERKLNS